MLVVYMEGSTFVPFVQPGVMHGVEETMILAAGAGSAGFRRDRPKRTVKPFVHLYKTCLRECATRGAQKAIFCCNYGVDGIDVVGESGDCSQRADDASARK